MEYGRRDGNHGRLPVKVNVCLEEFCNIGKLVDFKRVLEVCRGSNIFCQLIVQSIPQLKDRYPRTEWEELIGCTDIQICLGCNDVDTATYISKKCGVVTIKVENNQMPLQPLFSPVYNTTRPYSQTKSNTQRPLMYPDEVLRMDNRECLVMLRAQPKILKLYKITPEEFPDFPRLKDVRVSEHIPRWRQFEEQSQAACKSAPLGQQEEKASPTRPQRSAEQNPQPPRSGQKVENTPPRKQPAALFRDVLPQYDYGLLDPELSDMELDVSRQAAQGGDPAAGQSEYGAFDLIETLPQDVGGTPSGLDEQEGRR